MTNPVPDPSHAPALATAVLFILVNVAVAAIDMASWFTHGRIASVSSVLQGWAREVPIFPIALGFVLGHLFWPSRRPPESFP